MVPSVTPAPPAHSASLALYVVVGGISTVTHYALAAALVEIARADPLPATMTGYAAGALVKYVLNYVIAFRSRERHVHAVPRFLLLLAVMFTANGLVFAALERATSLHYLLAQALTTILLIGPGYLASRFWIFRRC